LSGVHAPKGVEEDFKLEQEKLSKRRKTMVQLVDHCLSLKKESVTFTIVQYTVSLENGISGQLVIDYAVEVNNLEQEKFKHMLRTEESYAKEMPKKDKCAIPSLVQLTVNGTLGTNGSNAANLVEEESLPEQEILSSMQP